MKRIILLISAMMLVSGCGKPQKINLNLEWPDYYGEQEKARDAFRNKPIALEFEKDGIVLDCELSICGQITEATLELVKSYKNEFHLRADRIHIIHFVKEDYPLYDYRTDAAYIPHILKNEIIQEFFEVLNMIGDFEKQLGVRVEFPNSMHLKKSISPLLQVLTDNLSSLKAEVAYYNLLVMSSVYNSYSSKYRVLRLKLDDVRGSFTDLWQFISIFFRAHDVFPKITFHLEKDKTDEVETLKFLIKNHIQFAKPFSQLGYRSIHFFDFTAEMYGDFKAAFVDLAFKKSTDDKYWLSALDDLIRMNHLNIPLQNKIRHEDGLIELEGHAECLDKVEALIPDLKRKLPSLAAIVLRSSSWVKDSKSKYSTEDKFLYLNCKESLPKLKHVIESVPMN